MIINESNLLGGILSLCTSFNDAMYNGKLTTAKSHLQNNHTKVYVAVYIRNIKVPPI